MDAVKCTECGSETFTDFKGMNIIDDAGTPRLADVRIEKCPSCSEWFVAEAELRELLRGEAKP